jgi:hypothetical protein
VTVDLTGKTSLGLVVTNGGDNTNYDHADWADAKVTCTNTPPVPTIAQPASTLTYKVGDVIAYSGSASDAQDGAIPAAGLSWQVVVHHCPAGGACHLHFDLIPVTTGFSGSFTAPDHGDESFMEIILTATDSGGSSASTSVSLQPQRAQLTIDTSPAGLNIVYGSTTHVAPFTVMSVIGSKHTIFAPSPQGTHTFTSWSDGGVAQHDIVTPATNTTITATYSP